jgi:CelD/BcsL family acetyltransferase involved in cellulose biosynthesis
MTDNIILSFTSNFLGPRENRKFHAFEHSIVSFFKIFSVNYSQPLDVRISTTDAELECLRDDWSNLAKATPHMSGSQSWDYAAAAWRHVHARGWDLHVVAVRRAGRLVGVWPLAIRREAGLRVATHLGRGSDEEYAGPLIAPGPQAEEVARRTLTAARQGVDLLEVFNLHPENPVRPLLHRVRCGFRSATPVHIARTGAHGTMESWLSSRTRKFRSNLSRSRQKLDALGEARIRQVEDPAEVPAFVDWLFARKRAQLDRQGVTRSWLQAPASRRLYEQILAAGDKPGCARAFEVTIDGRRIAAAVALEGARYELAVTTYDPAFADASPGVALHAFVARQALDHGLDLDFRFGDEPYKAWWTDEVETRWNYAVAFTPLGSLGVAAAWSRQGWRALRRRLGPTVKRMLGR